ncbi:MAG: hypothetical protein DWQ10_13635 [Calditrichaeota bacterium]|nr:MAG: hypothetical protein DWQ10_13635 [Calditrichota bacterium]
MKTINCLATIFIALLFLHCSNPSSPNEHDQFAIYLLANESLSTRDIEEESLAKLKLKDRPSISFNDINGYELKNHKVYLNKNFSYYFGGDSLTIFSHIFGKPFVLVANETRIYLGSFVSGVSSYAPNTPKIVDFTINNTEKSFRISGAPIYDESTYSDKRNDIRIIGALGAKLQ